MADWAVAGFSLSQSTLRWFGNGVGLVLILDYGHRRFPLVIPLFLPHGEGNPLPQLAHGWAGLPVPTCLLFLGIAVPLLVSFFVFCFYRWLYTWMSSHHFSTFSPLTLAQPPFFSLFAVMIRAKQEHAFIPSLHREIWWQRKKPMFYVHTSKEISWRTVDPAFMPLCLHCNLKVVFTAI